MITLSQQKEYGDFQTPLSLARRVAMLVKQREKHICTVIEPTCGTGAFLQAAVEIFGLLPTYRGFDINPEYVNIAGSTLAQMGLHQNTIQQKNFYDIDWKEFISEQAEEILVIGNPPWITNAGMGVISGNNLPQKSNFQGHKGFAAKTGKANFDISEWMLIQLLEALQGKDAVVVMLCKTSIARKVLKYAWNSNMEIGPSSIHIIDAAKEFGVAVNACLLYTHTGRRVPEMTATIYPSLTFDNPIKTFGIINKELVSDVDAYSLLSDLDSLQSNKDGLEFNKWRSGVKHDAVKVMEFRRIDGVLINGFGEKCEIEEDYIYPILKSSDLAKGRLKPVRFVLLPQRYVGESTDAIKINAPMTWRYLINHAQQFDKRRSSIYTNRSRFSIFGVGDYSFSPAKVAISGLYKNLNFQPIGSCCQKPIMVDDTCYFLPCNSMSEANIFADLLNSDMNQKFISSLVFSDSKRPITIDVLKRINLEKLRAFS